MCPATWVDEFSGATLGHACFYIICIKVIKLVRVEPCAAGNVPKNQIHLNIRITESLRLSETDLLVAFEIPEKAFGGVRHWQNANLQERE